MKSLSMVLGTALSLAAAAACAQSAPWSSAAGWETGAEFEGRQFLGCGTSHPGGPGFLGIARFAAGDWFLMLGVARLSGDLRVRIEVDGQPLPERTGRGDGPTADVPLTPDDLTAMAAGTELRVVIHDHADGRWTLAGAGAAIAAVDACVVARGRG
ncbi:MAG: hypothetical protein KDK12_08615 [Rhodobacteraceae bacterium]|nr:hypothetical protein [Paracoccaceae bacterium]